jgi:hypothetical protein
MSTLRMFSRNASSWRRTSWRLELPGSSSYVAALEAVADAEGERVVHDALALQDLADVGGGGKLGHRHADVVARVAGERLEELVRGVRRADDQQEHDDAEQHEPAPRAATAAAALAWSRRGRRQRAAAVRARDAARRHRSLVVVVEARPRRRRPGRGGARGDRRRAADALDVLVLGVGILLGDGLLGLLGHDVPFHGRRVDPCGSGRRRGRLLRPVGQHVPLDGRLVAALPGLRRVVVGEPSTVDRRELLVERRPPRRAGSRVVGRGLHRGVVRRLVGGLLPLDA